MSSNLKWNKHNENYLLKTSKKTSLKHPEKEGIYTGNKIRSSQSYFQKLQTKTNETSSLKS